MKVADFGISTAIPSGRETVVKSGLLGTLLYIPPEIVHQPLAVGQQEDHALTESDAPQNNVANGAQTSVFKLVTTPKGGGGGGVGEKGEKGSKTLINYLIFILNKFFFI